MKTYIIITFVGVFLILSAPVFAGDVLNEDIHICEKSYIDIVNGSTNRIPFSGKGDSIEFRVPNGTSSVTVSEEKRKPRIVEEIVTIVKAIREKEVEAIVPQEIICASYVQKYKRSTITVTALDKGNKELAVSKELIAGPAEHLYLSADLPVTNIKQLTYDSSSSKVVEKEKPASFYLGVNYQVGDIFTDYPGSKFYKKLSLKLMLKASSKPSESMGIGIAYSFDAADIFAARIRTKDDPSVGGSSLGSTDATVIGASFNITKGIEWYK